MTASSEIADAGYTIIDGVFDAREMDDIPDALRCAELPRSRAGTRHVMRSAQIAAFARQERLLSLVRPVLGKDAVPYRATLFDKSATSNWLVVWHQDTALPLQQRSERPGWGPWSVKSGIIYAHAPTPALERVLALRVHLDDSTAQNGPLRVVPGTHQCGVLPDAAVQQLARSGESVDCLVDKGGVLAMRPLLIHASSKSCNAQPRRVLHIEYASSLCIAPDMELAVA